MGKVLIKVLIYTLTVAAAAFLAACGGGDDGASSPTPVATATATATPTASAGPTGSPTTGPTISPTPTATDSPTVAPTSSPTIPTAGAPYSLPNLESVWQSRAITVTTGDPASGFGDFDTAAVEMRLTRESDTMELSVLVYRDSEAAGVDWELVPGQTPTAKAGRILPEHISTWWNENIVVVVHATSGDIGSEALAGFLDLGV
jgi:hypothetical protein